MKNQVFIFWICLKNYYLCVEKKIMLDIFNNREIIPL